MLLLYILTVYNFFVAVYSSHQHILYFILKIYYYVLTQKTEKVISYIYN